MQLFFLVCRPLSLFASNDNNSIVKTRFSINQVTMETAKYLGMVSSLLPPNDFYKKGKKMRENAQIFCYYEEIVPR